MKTRTTALRAVVPEMQKRRVLILCTGNSARSQMAKACFDTMPATGLKSSAREQSPGRVRPEAIQVMKELDNAL